MKKITPQQIAKIKAAQKARWAKIKAAKQSTAVDLEVLPPVKLAPVANLSGGDDKAEAKKLNKLFTDAQNGLRKIIALGLLAWEIKESKLKHGEFGNWLATHCPKLATLDSVTGKPRASRALSGYMELTKSVLENVGCPTIEKYLETIAKCANDAHLGGGKFLLIADKKVPESLKAVHDKICELVDGKTQKALFSEFKQCDDDTGKPKIGRVKGQGGATKEQRANAAELEAQEIINERKLKAQEIAEWLLLMSDDQGLGEIAGTPELAQLDKAMETARGYIKHQGGGK